MVHCFPGGIHKGFLDGSVGTESACNGGDTRDAGLIPGLGRSPGGGNGNPFQYSGLKKSHLQRSLAGYSPNGHKELDTIERLSMHTHNYQRESYLIT